MTMLRMRLVMAVGAAFCWAGLVPAASADTEPPVVTVTYPAGGEVLGSGSEQTITWIAEDDSGFIIAVSVFVSFDGGLSWDPLAIEIVDEGALTWFVHNRPTTEALIRVTALDAFLNEGAGESQPFGIVSSASGRLPTTLRDFDMPGTQPLDIIGITTPEECSLCHGGYDQAVEPTFSARGSMMRYASVDPVFEAALEIANMDAPESGDLCLRCHIPNGWLVGNSNPTDGRRMTPEQKVGVSCDLCHRMVDPYYEEGASPAVDEQILANLEGVPTEFVLAQYVVDPDVEGRRGPFDDALYIHNWYYSPFHQDSAFCGTCHDVSNPAFSRNPDGTYSANTFDQPASEFGAHQIKSVERTYSEWYYSEYNSAEGVYAPQFGGNKTKVSTCQDCHMRDVSGKGCNFPGAPDRDDLPLHDLSGGSTWMLSIMNQIEPAAPVAALQAGVLRARYMLQNAAELALAEDGGQLGITITNNTGHKLPTGYPEGRRMWINVKFYDAEDTLIGESGAYDTESAELTLDAEAKVYEGVPAISEELAPVVGLPAGTPFHFVLNDTWLKDNRIPPRGFTNANYAYIGAAPVGAVYADGQYWDTTTYEIPAGAARAEVAVYYQSLSKEYIEFLRDNGVPGGAGQVLYDLWEQNGKAPPELMVMEEITFGGGVAGDLNCDGVVNNFDIDPFVLALTDPAGYAAAYPECDIALGDVNGDGAVNNFDIDPFVALLTGG